MLLTLTILGLTTSCSNDDDILGTINETFIIGKWQLSNVTQNGMDISLNDCQQMNTLEFNTSNKVVTTIYDFNADDVCEILTNTIKDYSINNSTITIEDANASEISTPRNETLILKSVEASDVIIKTFTRQ